MTGRDRIDLLHRLSSNDLAPLVEVGRVVSSLFTTNKGRVVDWVWMVARDSEILLRTSAGRGERVRDWIDNYTIVEDVVGHDDSGRWERVVVHGRGASALVGVDVPPGVALEDARGLWTRGLEAHGERLELLTTAPADDVVADLVGRGGVRADGGELELWRVRAGEPAPCREFEAEVNPLELRLGAHAISFDKGCFIGQEVLARMDSYDKLARVLIGFESAEPLPSSEPLKLRRDGRPLGRVTSAHNADGGAVGLAVVKREAAIDGEIATLVTGAGAEVPVRLCDRPFWA